MKCFIFAMVCGLIIANVAHSEQANPWDNGNVAARQQLIDDMNTKMSHDNFLGPLMANPQPSVTVSTGVSIPRPFAFDDGNGISLIGYADYDKVAKKFAPEGMVPRRISAGGHDFAVVIFDVTAYSRTSFGPAYVARISTPIILDDKTVRYIEGKLDSTFQDKVQYAVNLFYWKYWEGGAKDAVVAGREVLYWPQEGASVKVSWNGDVKSADVKAKNNKKIFSFSFGSKDRLDQAERVLSTALVIAATPGNKRFNPSAVKAVYNVVPLQGVKYENQIPFNPSLDTLELGSSLKQELAEIGFTTQGAVWILNSYYQGVFLPNPPSVKGANR